MPNTTYTEQEILNATFDVANGRLKTDASISVAPEVEIKNDSGNPVPVSASSLPLPAGASTEATLALIKTKTDNLTADPSTGAKQDTGNTSLATIAGKDFATQATLALIKDTDGIKKITDPLPAGTSTIGGTIPKTATSGGPTTFHLVSAASTNATNLKASAGQVYGWYIYNSNASARKVAFHNNAGTPTAGASIYFSLVLPATSAANVFIPHGIPFSTGIAITMVTGLADSDATAVAANDLVANIWYA